jgi:hypothetical protein
MSIIAKMVPGTGWGVLKTMPFLMIWLAVQPHSDCDIGLQYVAAVVTAAIVWAILIETVDGEIPGSRPFVFFVTGLFTLSLFLPVATIFLPATTPQTITFLHWLALIHCAFIPLVIIVSVISDNSISDMELLGRYAIGWLCLSPIFGLLHRWGFK